MAEALQALRRRAGIEAAHRAGRPVPQHGQDGGDAALDLEHVAVGEGRRDHAHHLSVLVRILGAHELQGVGIDEAVIVMEVELVEAAAQLVETHGRS